MKNLYLVACCLFYHSLLAQTSENPTAKSYLVKTTGEKFFMIIFQLNTNRCKKLVSTISELRYKIIHKA